MEKLHHEDPKSTKCAMVTFDFLTFDLRPAEENETGRNLLKSVAFESGPNAADPNGT